MRWPDEPHYEDAVSVTLCIIMNYSKKGGALPKLQFNVQCAVSVQLIDACLCLFYNYENRRGLMYCLHKLIADVFFTL